MSNLSNVILCKGALWVGSVQRETNNSALDNLSNYENLKHLRRLVKHYKQIGELAQFGDSVAMAIYIDLKTCLEPGSTVLTAIQRYCITMVDIERHTLREVADMMDRSPSTIQDNIGHGLVRMRKALLTGLAYSKGARESYDEQPSMGHVDDDGGLFED
jgi:DNA-directed RNA polymerase specialized sigma24 family protein